MLASAPRAPPGRHLHAPGLRVPDVPGESVTRIPARLLEEAAACDWSDAPFARARAVELAVEILDYLPRDTPGVLRARWAAVVLERAQPRPECARRGAA